MGKHLMSVHGRDTLAADSGSRHAAICRFWCHRIMQVHLVTVLFKLPCSPAHTRHSQGPTMHLSVPRRVSISTIHKSTCALQPKCHRIPSSAPHTVLSTPHSATTIALRSLATLQALVNIATLSAVFHAPGKPCRSPPGW